MTSKPSLSFGITPREWGNYFAEALGQIKVAEKYGFESVWFEEHHEHSEYLPSPLIALSTVALHTKLILGTDILILPLYNPIRLAEDVAMLDVVTNGRVIIGVAAGYREKDFKNFGANIKKRGEFMDESLRLLDLLLTKTHVSFHGKHFQVSDATIEPRPSQQPRPPIWVGGWKRKALERAAKLGDAWFPGPTATLGTVLKCKTVYEEELSRLNKSIPTLPIMRDIYVAETTDIALRESEESFTHMYQEDYRNSGHPLIAGADMSFLDWAADRFIIGSPEVAIEQIARIQKQGFDKFVFRVSLRRLTDDRIQTCIRILGEKVLPYFSGAS